MKPNFIGLGGQKCASTWLYAVFADHPEVYVSAPKDVDFFSSFYDRGNQWYEAHFDNAEGKRAVGEISVSYLPDSDAPARAHAYNPDFRIIVALRDPVERVYSNHLHEIRLGHFSSRDLSFEVGLLNNPMYVEQSRYAKHLARWLEYFPVSQVLVILQEDIRTNPQREARRLYTFLGIDPEHVSGSVGDRANESYLPRSKRREQFVQLLGRIVRGIGLRWFADWLRRVGIIAAIHRGNRQNIREIVPPMRDETRETLYELLGAETIELAAMLNRDSLPWRTWERAVHRRRSGQAKAGPT
jgi:hypothetical protein